MENLDNYHLISCEGLPQKNKLHLDFGAVVLHRLIKYYSGFAFIPILLAILMCVTPNPRTYHRHSTSTDMNLWAPACKHRSLRSLLLEC